MAHPDVSISAGIKLTLSALLDGKNINAGGHKLGLGLEFQAQEDEADGFPVLPAHTRTHTHIPHQKEKKNSKSFIDQASPHKTPVSPLGMLQLEARQNKGQIVLMTIYPLLKDHFKGTLYFANIEPSSEQNYNCKSESFFLELFSLQGKGSSGTSMLASLFVTSLRSYTML